MNRIAIFFAIIAAAYAAGWAHGRGDGQERIAALEASVASCNARVSDILEHEERADEVNDLSGDDLRDRAGQFLREE